MLTRLYFRTRTLSVCPCPGRFAFSLAELGCLGPIFRDPCTSSQVPFPFPFCLLPFCRLGLIYGLALVVRDGRDRVVPVSAFRNENQNERQSRLLSDSRGGGALIQHQARQIKREVRREQTRCCTADVPRFPFFKDSLHKPTHLKK
jgi:hypothetical protein